MSSFLRGEEMRLCQIYFQSPEFAYSGLAQLGELGLVQFRDMNPNLNAYSRKLVNEVRRCEEMERKLRFIEKEIAKDISNLKIVEPTESCEPPKQKEMFALETTLEQLEHDLIEVNSNKDAMKKNFIELIELKQILLKAEHFFYDNNQNRIGDQTGLISIEGPAVDPQGHALRLGFLIGILNRDKIHNFELMLWRMCRGNVFLKTSDVEEPIEDSETGNNEAKVVFIIFFQGDMLKQKCRKICDGFNARLYPCPENTSERRDMLKELRSRIDDLSTVIDQSLSLRKSLLVNASENIRTWFFKILKMKAIYHTMNMFQFDQKSMIGECWIPLTEISHIRDILDKETKKLDINGRTMLNIVDSDESPPTFHRVNKFTSGFQNIVNAYGVANYREINPAPFTVITFPFLFAIMFGDSGHGLIMLIAALLLVLKENTLKRLIKGNEVFEMMFGGRYIILLMGLFSVYTGLIYNDVFGKSMNLFGSKWRVSVGYDFPFEKISDFNLDPNPYSNKTDRMYTGSPYPFGVDPIWQVANNKIAFTNTMKMKFSIIIGICQMCFGLVLGLMNHLYFKRTLKILVEFIPQIIFMSVIFVYLCILIFIKWIKYAGTSDSETGSCAPNLLIQLINMFFLKDSSIDPITKKIDYCKRVYPNQPSVEIGIVIISVICIPVMLLARPCILRYRHNKKLKNGHSPLLNRENSVENGSHGAEIEEEFDFGEIFVEQTIHSIEYFLGCISHTASYLRLWALSLAHAQLSEVSWNMLIKKVILMPPPLGPIALVFVFTGWACITVGILCVMEGLSAFLHALRLHWVEFQSKFYQGEGYEFTPFSFERILKETEYSKSDN